MDRLSSSPGWALFWIAMSVGGCTTQPPAALDCTTDSDCPAGTACDVVNHFCRAAQPLPDVLLDLDAAFPDVGSLPDVSLPDGSFIPDAAVVDASSTPDAGPRGIAYVVSRIPVAYPNDVAPGVDLDGMSGGPVGSCTDQADYTSPISGSTAVDNQFLGLIGLLEPRVHVETEILEGRYLVGLRLSNVDDWTTDANVTVELVRLAASGGAPVADGHGLAANQAFTVVASLGTTTATIAGARITIQTTVDLPTWYRYGTSAVSIHDVTLRIDLRAPLAPVLELGGSVPVTELTAYGNANGLPFDPDNLAAFAGPDLAPDTFGDYCAQMSAGLAPVLVPAMFP